VSWTQTLFDVIDTRSFSNLWFWIVLAVAWSSASQWVLGVPYDMVTRARRHGGVAEEELEDLVRVNVLRILRLVDGSGLLLLGLVSFVLTALAILGFGYRVEFAQALFLLALPLSGVGALSVRTAQQIRSAEPQGAALHRALSRHRHLVQVTGMVSIFVTALWGMSQTLGRPFPFNGF